MSTITQRFVVFAVAVVLAGGLPTSLRAADAAWVSAKVLESGVPNNCGASYPDYRIEIKGNSFKSVPISGDTSEASSTTLNLKSLNPDGSGKITITNKAGKTWNYEFSVGNGPRKIKYGNEFTSCRYAWVPK
jgi:hypothetical protein